MKPTEFIVAEFQNIPSEYTGWISPINTSQYFFYVVHHNKKSMGYTFHKLDGPSRIWLDKDGVIKDKEFYIHSYHVREEVYWNHPLVVEHRLNHILSCDQTSF